VPAATLSREEGNLVCAAAAKAASMGEMTTQEQANAVSVASVERVQSGWCLHPFREMTFVLTMGNALLR
jgi:hypothetical protein